MGFINFALRIVAGLFTRQLVVFIPLTLLVKTIRCYWYSLVVLLNSWWIQSFSVLELWWLHFWGLLIKCWHVLCLHGPQTGLLVKGALVWCGLGECIEDFNYCHMAWTSSQLQTTVGQTFCSHFFHIHLPCPYLHQRKPRRCWSSETFRWTSLFVHFRAIAIINQINLIFRTWILKITIYIYSLFNFILII